MKSWCIIFRNNYDVKSITEIPCFQKMDEEGVVLLNYELGMYIYWVKSRNHNWFLYRYIQCFVIGCTSVPKYISFTIPTTVKCYLNVNSPISGNNCGHGLRAMLPESLCVTLKKSVSYLFKNFVIVLCYCAVTVVVFLFCR